MLNEKEKVVIKALMLLDAFIVALAFFSAYFLRTNIHFFYKLDLFESTQVIKNAELQFDNFLVVFLLVVPLWCLSLYFNGIYSSLRTKSISDVVWELLKSSFYMGLIFATGVFFLKFESIGRLFFVMFALVSTVFLFFEKILVFYILHRVWKRGINQRNVLIVGKGKRTRDFIQKLHKHPEWGIHVLGVIDDEPGKGPSEQDSVGFIGDLDNLQEIFHEHAVDEVIFLVPRSRLNFLQDAIYTCEMEGIKATIAVDLFDCRIAKAQIKEIDGAPLVTFETTVAKEWQLFVKRSMDIAVSGISIILLIPFFLLVSIVIKLTSKGPIIFKQSRVGLNGRDFVLYKFRTMENDAYEKLNDINVYDDSDSIDFREKKSMFITRAGKIIRKLSIDELPQLYNVLLGHMSLIGPRPTISEEISQYKPWQRRRLSMRPGLTCLWQVSGRNNISFEEWMKLDLMYIDSWSFWLDIKILIKTIPAVLSGKGAY